MIELIGDNVLIEEDKSEDTTESGLIMPNVYDSHPLKGTVVAVGIGRLLKSGVRIPHQCKIGDTVLFGASHKSDVVYEGKNYIAIPEEHLLGIVKEG